MQTHWTFTRLDAGATADETRHVSPPSPGPWRLERAHLLPNATSTEHADNYATITIKNGSDTLASRDTQEGEGGTLTAATAAPLTLAGGKAREVTGITGAVEIEKTHAGTGVAVDVEVCCEWTKLREQG